MRRRRSKAARSYRRLRSKYGVRRAVKIYKHKRSVRSKWKSLVKKFGVKKAVKIYRKMKRSR